MRKAQSRKSLYNFACFKSWVFLYLIETSNERLVISFLPYQSNAISSLLWGSFAAVFSFYAVIDVNTITPFSFMFQFKILHLNAKHIHCNFSVQKRVWCNIIIASITIFKPVQLSGSDYESKLLEKKELQTHAYSRIVPHLLNIISIALVTNISLPIVII